MSSTITETERRTVPGISSEISPEAVLKKRENFTRSTSIEKLKKFNNYICSQHYYLLPSVLFWLKTSQNIITSNMEKCMLFIKSFFLITTLQGCLQKTTKETMNLTSTDMLKIVNILLIKSNDLLVLIFEEIKKLLLISTIYLGVCLIFLQLFGIICLIFFKIPPLGFIFLVGCVLYMSRIASIVMFKPENKEITENVNSVEEKKKIRKQLTLIGKTISNVKLF